eukprot:TRINITY_DN4746_c0_g1_i2.p1 TRINITY_DN4746_c0_g1~~TRINITY_DN4746_c0_g1_i2.p1  ORF type:complete len:143 (-),score=14.02 TRINITY_DN4746_c0_g1_i2:90-518(-)
MSTVSSRDPTQCEKLTTSALDQDISLCGIPDHMLFDFTTEHECEHELSVQTLKKITENSLISSYPICSNWTYNRFQDKHTKEQGPVKFLYDDPDYKSHPRVPPRITAEMRRFIDETPIIKELYRVDFSSIIKDIDNLLENDQ